jgi:hypothetical protein
VWRCHPRLHCQLGIVSANSGPQDLGSSMYNSDVQGSTKESRPTIQGDDASAVAHNALRVLQHKYATSLRAFSDRVAQAVGEPVVFGTLLHHLGHLLKLVSVAGPLTTLLVGVSRLRVSGPITPLVGGRTAAPNS